MCWSLNNLKEMNNKDSKQYKHAILIGIKGLIAYNLKVYLNEFKGWIRENLY
jgi:hypothetical protein